MLRRNGHRTERIPETDGSDRGPRIAARDIVKTYDTGTPRGPALRGVDFAVGRGEMAAAMGRPGCGRKILPNCLAARTRAFFSSLLIRLRRLLRSQRASIHNPARCLLDQHQLARLVLR